MKNIKQKKEPCLESIILSHLLLSDLITQENILFFSVNEYEYELNEDNVEIYTDNNGRSALKFKGFNPSEDGTEKQVIATLQKKNPKSKLKIRNAVNSIIVDKSSNAESV